MKYYKANLAALIRDSLPEERKPILTAEQIERLKTAAETVLAVVATGLIMVSAIAPNIFEAGGRRYGRVYGRKPSRREQERKIRRTFYYLKERGYIKMKWTGKDFKIFLTRLGKKKIEKIDFENLQIPESRSWDGKWWQVAADIPTEDHKIDADLFRGKLKLMNFFPLQRTLWFYPHDPREEIDIVAARYGIENFVTVMEINRLDRDDEEKMREFFEERKIIPQKLR